MATPASDDATLYRLTSELIRTDHAPHVETAILQGRAADRYHRFKVVTRKFANPSRLAEPESGCYGLYLSKGAVLTLTNEDEHGVVREGAPFTVRLVHIFHFSRPGMCAAELTGERELHAPMVIEFPDKPLRPLDAVLDLAPRLLGPLPPDLADSLLPAPAAAAAAGPRAAALASQLFATWLAGLPLQPVLQTAGAVAAAPAAPATGAAAAEGSATTSPSWMSGLLGLWNRVLGSKAADKRDKAEGERGKVAEPAGKEEAAAAAPKLELAEAWAQYEQRASLKDAAAGVDGAAAGGGGGSELELAWIREVLSCK